MSYYEIKNPDIKRQVDNLRGAIESLIDYDKSKDMGPSEAEMIRKPYDEIK